MRLSFSARGRRVLSFAVAVATASLSGCKKDADAVPAVPIEAIDPKQATGDASGSAPGQLEPNPSGPTREAEPNDNREAATALPVNGVVLGAIQFRQSAPPADGTTPAAPAPPADEDWYVLLLETPTTQQIRLQLTPEDRSDLVLEWMSATPNAEAPIPRGKNKRRPPPPRSDVLASVDNTEAGGIEIFPPTPLAPGKHYFRVRVKQPKAGKRGAPAPVDTGRDRPYRLSTTVVDTEPALEQEPNADSSLAGVLRPNEPRQGFIGWPKDQDWYRLDLSTAAPGSFLRVTVSGVPDVKARLLLADKNKATLTKIPEGRAAWDPGKSVVIRDFTVTPEAQPYFVAVDSMRGASPSERYTLTLEVEPAADGREIEPNWKTTSANKLAAEAPITGWIAHPSDWDVYRLDSPDPVVATVTVAGVPEVDLQLELIRNNKVIATVSDGGSGQPETIPLVPVGPEPAFVRISGKAGTCNPIKSYAISSSVTQVGSGELEPNNDFADVQGSTLAIGQTAEGHVHPRGDLDLYAFEVRGEPGSVRPLLIELTGVSGMSLALQLYDASKALITKKSAIGQDPKTIESDLAPGRYFIRVREESGQLADAEHAYVVRLIDPAALGEPSDAPPGPPPQ